MEIDVLKYLKNRVDKKSFSLQHNPNPSSKKQEFLAFYAPSFNSRLTRKPWRSHPSHPPISPPDFMQPESTELPQETSISTNPSDPVNNSQHGFHSDQLPATGLHVSSLEGNATSGGSSETRSPSDAALQDKLSQLRLDEKSETRPKPSFQRISEYENALSPSPPRKPNHGPTFTVVRKSGNAFTGPQLEHFPNGNCPFV